MAITTYAELKTAVASWLARDDLTAQIPDFVALAESEIRRRLRSKVVREALTLTADEESIDLPSGVGELRSVRLNTGVYFFNINLVTPETLADYRTAGAGMPRWGAVVDGELLLVPTPDTSYTAEVIYYAALTPLTDSATTNSTLADSPDIYLFATLVRASVFLEHDERVPVWRAELERAIQDENNAREQSELGASPRPVRLPVVF